MTNWSPIDWSIVAVYLLGTLFLAVWTRRRDAEMTDFVVAGRGVRTSLGVATMIGSELGLVTVMYSAQKGFTGGYAAFHIPLLAGIAALVVGATGFIVEPLRRMKVLTIPEFYGRRFGPRVRILGGLILALAGILNMGLFLRAGSLFVAGVTGLDSDLHVKLIMSALLGLVLVYVVAGGMIAVIVTDYVQFIVLSFGLILTCLLALTRFDFGQLGQAITTVHGAAGFDPFDAEGFGVRYVAWMFFTAGIVSCAVWQTAVMRACSMESTSQVRRLYAISSVGFVVRSLFPTFLGVCALAWALETPTARAVFLASGELASPSVTLSAFPAFLGALLPAGVVGLVAAGMLAAFMSTHDSYLLCWSSVLVQDVIAPLRRRALGSSQRVFLTRVIIVGLGLFLLIWSLWYPLSQDLWDYMAVTGAIYFTGGFAVLVLGLYWRRASRVGAVLALCSGGIAALGLEPVRRLVGWDALVGIPLSGETAGLISVTVAMTGMVVGSLVVPDRSTGDPPAAAPVEGSA